MTLPLGVTARQAGEPLVKMPKPRNVLEAAAMLPDRDAARRMIEAALGLDTHTVRSQENLSKPDRWARLDPSSRLMEIAEWIKAECFECMDLVETPAISTLGD